MRNERSDRPAEEPRPEAVAPEGSTPPGTAPEVPAPRQGEGAPARPEEAGEGTGPGGAPHAHEKTPSGGRQRGAEGDEIRAHEAGDAVEELQQLAARYKEDAERNWQQFLHTAADLENYKKQSARQRDEAVHRARTALLTVMLTVVDNLERALAHAGSDPEAVLEGIRMTHRQVLDVLAGLGVRPLEAQGKSFDPRYHEAIDVAAHTDAGVSPGTVIDELQRGYLLNGEVLRPARVRVAK